MDRSSAQLEKPAGYKALALRGGDNVQAPLLQALDLVKGREDEHIQPLAGVAPQRLVVLQRLPRCAHDAVAQAELVARRRQQDGVQWRRQKLDSVLS